MLFGAKTGRDGIGGASVLASAELDDSEDKRPTVQIGDPFTEKKLLECSLELLDRGLLVALQDLGAAGLTSSSAEMAAKGEVGLDLDVRRVPLREADMEPFEIMVSESQERMLCVVEPAQLEEVLAVCARWEVNGTAIGEVTDTRRLRVFDGESWSATCPSSRWWTSARPTTSSPPSPRRRCIRRRRWCCRSDDPGEILVGAARLLQRRLAQVGVRAVRLDRRLAHRPPARAGRRRRAAAAVRRRPTRSTVALPRRRRRRRGPRSRSRSTATAAASPPIPYRGAVEAVLECSANLACVGAEPLGLTNCLNFGNPEKPHIAWQFTRAIAGLGDACRAFGIPVVGGNVSLYNEGGEGPIYPTPVVGLVGELPDARRAGRLGFVARGRRDRAGHRRLGAVAGGLGAVQAARRAGRRAAAGASTSARSRRSTPRSARPSAPARCTPRTTSPRVASRSRWPSRALASGLGATVSGWPARPSCSARARARSSSPARPRR